MIGKVFDKLTVTAPSVRLGGRQHWMCRCECGNVRRVREDALLRGNTRSCGCLSKSYHQAVAAAPAPSPPPVRVAAAPIRSAQPPRPEARRPLPEIVAHWKVLRRIEGRRTPAGTAISVYLCRCVNCSAQREVFRTALIGGTTKPPACVCMSSNKNKKKEMTHVEEKDEERVRRPRQVGGERGADVPGGLG